MKVAELLERRREHWQELERLCALVAAKRKKSLLPEQISRFATLYRAACADLALADSYQLPPNTVQYLHRLVGRAHNQLYRSQQFNVRAWAEILLMEVPQKIFRDRCVQLMFCLFWGGFLLSACLAYSTSFWPQYATNMLTDQGIESMTEMFKNPISRGPGQSSANFAAAGFYIQHNTTIGLKCFGGGLGVIPGIFITLYNAAHLGASFGYMARPDVAQGENFFHFVTAHGPFELTAIVLSAGAGLRLGMSWISTQRLTRVESLKKTAREAMPIMGAAMIMFFLAALIEGFISPSPLPYIVKATISVCSSGMLMFYFVVLGFPRTR
ncbi:MAG: stage II sporulation protein M [Pirellulaceae bacterium]|nr:stage II sporulation protein M [Pirellulaceae bacterium]